MPIKEIIAISAVIMTSIIATNPTHPKVAIRNVQMRILREVRRTDNWGSPSIFRHKSPRERGDTVRFKWQ